MRRICVNAFALGASMFLLLNGPDQNNMIIPHHGIIGADAALGSLKRVVGQGWRVGGRAMCAFFNKNYDSIKTLSYAKGSMVKERFETLSWEWLRITDALSSHGDDNALITKFEELKREAKAFFDEIVGASITEDMPPPDFGMQGPVDPFEKQLLELRHRQEAQLQEMMAQMRLAQEREQEQLERSVKERRELAQQALQITNAVRVLLNKSKGILEQAQGALNDLPQAVTSIDKLVVRIRQAIPSIQAMSAEHYSPEVANALKGFKDEMDKNRDTVSHILQNSESLIHQATAYLDNADDQAQTLFEFGPDARNTTEPLLTASARLRIFGSELVEYVKNILPKTEAKQLECRELYSKLEGALMLLSTKVWGLYSKKINDIESSIKSLSSKEVVEILNRSENVLKTIKAAIERLNSSSTLASDAQRNFEAVAEQVNIWQNDSSSIRSRLDHFADQYQEIKRLLLTLRNDTVTLDLSSLEKVFAESQNLQNALRRQRSLITSQFNMLQVRTNTIVENSLKTSGLYGLNPMGMPGMGMGMPVAMGGMPVAMGGMPVAMGGMPVAMGGMPGAMGVMPGNMGGMPGAMGGMPGAMGVMPGNMGGMPGAMGGMPGSMGVMPGNMGGMPGNMGGMPGSMNGNKPF